MSLRLVFTLVMLGFLTCTAQANPSEFVPGEYIVKLKNHVKPATFLVSTLGVENEEARLINNESNAILLVRSMLERPEAVIEKLSSNPSIEYVEPNYVWYLDETTPNDPDLGELWGLANTGKNGGTEGIDIDAQRAWDITTGDKKVIVAVIDTGIDFTHPDLKDNMWVNEAEASGIEGVDDDKNGFVDDIHGYDFVNNDSDPSDDWGHGTHVAGTIGARGNDGVGVTGVAWEVSLMSVQIFSKKGQVTTEKIIRAIDYATMMEAKIMNNSWGGGGYSEAMKEAIVRAGDVGILFVASAGNQASNVDEDPHYPSSYELHNVISVAAITHTGDLSGFSNYGKTVDVAAPGSNIYSSQMGGGYISKSGTSMAAPHVSGVAALLLSSRRSRLNLSELKDHIVATARPLPALEGKVRSGLVNAYQALTE